MEGRPNIPAFDAETQIDQEASSSSRESGSAECPEPTLRDAPKVEIRKFHPFADIFALIEGEAFDRFVADIKQNGLIENIVTTPDGRILEGRNRYLACLAAGVEPRFETIREPPEKWLNFVISKNVHRRQLTESQRALAAAKLVTTTHGDNRHTLRLEAVPVITQPQAAAFFGISDRLVRDALTVMKESEELHKLVKNGEAPVGVAADVVRNSPKHVATFIEEVKAGKTPVKAKRDIEAAKQSAPVDVPVPVNDVDNGEKADANLSPNRDEECADFLMAEVKPDRIPTLISLMESAKIKNVIEIMRRKLQPTPPSDGGGTPSGQKTVAKEGGGEPKKTSEPKSVKRGRSSVKPQKSKSAKTNFLHRVVVEKFKAFRGDDDAAEHFRRSLNHYRCGGWEHKDGDIIVELRKAIAKLKDIDVAQKWYEGWFVDIYDEDGKPAPKEQIEASKSDKAHVYFVADYVFCTLLEEAISEVQERREIEMEMKASSR